MKGRDLVKKAVMVSLFIGFAIAFLPNMVLAGPCDSWKTDYHSCLASHSPDQCACCVVTGSGDLSTMGCKYDVSHCPLPIGVLITQSNVILTNHEGKSIRFEPNCSATAWSTVGALAKTLPEGEMTNVRVDRLRVSNWTNGILFWRMQGGEIKNSIIEDNINGLYVFNAQNNRIFSNIIESNTGIGLVLESNKTKMDLPANGAKTENNTFYDNYFDNPENVNFLMVGWGGGVDPWSNTFNIASTLGSNILAQLEERHGNYIGGNYWAGYSDTDPCGCNGDTGFCNNPYLVYMSGSKPNKDLLPLCQPPAFIDITVTGEISNWVLNSGYNEKTGISVIVSTNSYDWYVSVTDGDHPSDGMTGHMVKYTSGVYDPTFYLTEHLYIADVPITEGDRLITGSKPTSHTYPLLLSQMVDHNDKILPPDSMYRVVLNFTGMAF
jgi:parallel beta-helix repeat protein